MTAEIKIFQVALLMDPDERETFNSVTFDKSLAQFAYWSKLQTAGRAQQHGRLNSLPTLVIRCCGWRGGEKAELL